jgi:hypothetical protein
VECFDCQRLGHGEGYMQPVKVDLIATSLAVA